MSSPDDRAIESIARDPDLSRASGGDAQAKKEDSSFYEDANKALDLDERKLRHKIKSDALDSLKSLQTKLLVFAWVWLGAVFVVVLLAGFRCGDFDIDDDVLKFMVGSPVAAVIGAIVVNLRGAFSLLHRN